MWPRMQRYQLQEEERTKWWLAGCAGTVLAYSGYQFWIRQQKRDEVMMMLME